MNKNGLIIALIAFICLYSCGNGKTNSTEDSSKMEIAKEHPNASLIDSIKAITQNYGTWTTDCNEGSGLVNPPQNTQTTELLYDANKEIFYIRELWIYEHEVKSDTIYTCKIKRTEMGFMLIGIGDECTFEVRSNEWIEGIWPDVEYRTHGQGTIQFDVVKALIKE